MKAVTVTVKVKEFSADERKYTQMFFRWPYKAVQAHILQSSVALWLCGKNHVYFVHLRTAFPSTARKVTEFGRAMRYHSHPVNHQRSAMMEVNPITGKIADLKQRVDSLRGYL